MPLEKQPTVIVTSETPIDETIVRITMTVAVPNYLCSDHKDQTQAAYESAVDQITSAVSMGTDGYILGFSAIEMQLKPKAKA